MGVDLPTSEGNKMSAVLKIGFSLTTLGICLYGMRVFGPGLWSGLFALGGGLVLLSLFLPGLHIAAVILARLMGVLSVLALALLLVAGTIGGSFHLSPSNQVLAVGLALIGLFGSGFFLVRIPSA